MGEGAARAATGERHVRPLFLVTILLGSFLLFVTQPMVARMVLPRLGGAPAVWNSAMLVYQALLLAGYAYAHAIGGMRPWRQAGLHLALFALAALWLPIGLLSRQPPETLAPALWVPLFLAASIGPLFFLVSAQAPLMQRWYALGEGRREPYPLYAASNLGSFAGLLCYPLLVEPAFTLREQSLFWSGGYALLALLVAACALTIPRHAVAERPKTSSPAPPPARILLWVLLAAIPSGLMLSTNTHLTTDIVAMPLLWVLPLGLYLLSFTFAFAERRGPADAVTRIAPLILLMIGAFAFASGFQRPIVAATGGLTLLFAVAVALHTRLYRLRPPPDRLTGFYLWLAVGGASGGLFGAILAPGLFDWTYEHPILIAAAAALLPQSPLHPLLARLWEGPRGRLLAVAVPLLAFLLSIPAEGTLWPLLSAETGAAVALLVSLAALAAIGRPLVFAACMAALMLAWGGWGTILSPHESRTRSYFGIYSVSVDSDGDARLLTHGTTVHGKQNILPGREEEPTTYYARGSGVGLALAAVERLYGADADIAVVGLGTGTLACYREEGQDWTFFEIDPEVAGIARDSGSFTFLSRCAPEAGIVFGDARLSLAAAPEGAFDLIAVDAFSSDAIPIHLLTREALAVYRRALAPDGLLLLHISNRYLDLEPVVAAAAGAGGWSAMRIEFRPDRKAREANLLASTWVALSPSAGTIAELVAASEEHAEGWARLRRRPGVAPWTDDYASIVPLLKDLTQ
ncbi:MAG: spermidine synthase [Sphingomonadaceae bacterium]